MKLSMVAMVVMMTKRILALTVALLVALCFASCKKADGDKSDDLSVDQTSSYEFILEDDTDESMSPEDEKAAQDAWNSVVKDSDNAIEFEPYNPGSSSNKPTSSKPTESSSTPASLSKPESTAPSSSSTVTPSSSSESTPSQEEPDDNTEDTATSSKPGWRPGIY